MKFPKIAELSSPQRAEERHAIFRLLDLFRRRAAFIVMTAVCAGGATYLGCFFLTPKYSAVTTLVPLESGGGLTGKLALLSEITGGDSLSFSQSTPPEKIVAILSSQTVAANTILGLRLMPKLFPERWDSENQEWEDEPPLMQDALQLFRDKVVTVSLGQSGLLSRSILITVAVVFSDPDIAADIANRYIYELDSFLDRGSFTLAKRNRRFLESRLKEVKAEMSQMAERFQLFRKKYRFVDLDAEAEAAVRAAALLRAEIMMGELNMSVLKETASENDSRYKDLRRRRDEQAKQLRMLTGERTQSSREKATFPSFSVLTDLQLEFASLKRDLLMHEKLSELLMEQRELARIEEVRNDVAFQMIDKARYPERPFFPRPLLFAAIAFLLSGIGAAGYVAMSPRPSDSK